MNKTNEKLIINQHGLMKAQEHAHLGSWYLNITTKEVEWTDELYKIYGFSPNLPPPPFTEHSKLCFLPKVGSCCLHLFPIQEKQAFRINWSLKQYASTVVTAGCGCWVKPSRTNKMKQ